MEQAIQIFDNADFGEVRVVMVDDKAYFVGRDIAVALGYKEPAKAVREFVSEKFKGVSEMDTPGGKQKVVIINEAGLYKLVMRSKLPNAEKFSDWVCEEVLPLIRKQGMYINPNAPIDPRFLRRMADELEARDKKIAELQPKADYCVKVLESKEHLTSEQIAKEYGKTAAWLHETLIKLGAMYMRRRGKKYYYYMKSPYDKEGYRDSETSIIRQGMTVIDYYWTQKGRNFVYNFLKKHGILPVAEREDVMEALL